MGTSRIPSLLLTTSFVHPNNNFEATFIQLPVNLFTAFKVMTTRSTGGHDLLISGCFPLLVADAVDKLFPAGRAGLLHLLRRMAAYVGWPLRFASNHLKQIIYFL